MDKQPQISAPLYVAVALLLIPILYVTSYLCLVMPGRSHANVIDFLSNRTPVNYRVGEDTAKRLFWPLEQVDRKLRPRAWESWEPAFRSRPRPT